MCKFKIYVDTQHSLTQRRLQSQQKHSEVETSKDRPTQGTRTKADSVSAIRFGPAMISNPPQYAWSRVLAIESTLTSAGLIDARAVTYGFCTMVVNHTWVINLSQHTTVLFCSESSITNTSSTITYAVPNSITAVSVCITNISNLSKDTELSQCQKSWFTEACLIRTGAVLNHSRAIHLSRTSVS